MLKRLKITAIGSMVILIATTTACGSNNASPNNSAPTPNPTIQSGTGNTLSHSLSQAGKGLTTLGNDDAIVPIKVINNVNYIPARELVQTLKFQTDWDDTNQKLLVGDNDANYELTMNSTKAKKDGSDIHVNQPFVKEGDSAYLPISSLADLFQEDMSYEVSNGQLKIHPSPVAPIENEDDSDPRGNAAELEFSDDPTDPFKGVGNETNPASKDLQAGNDLQVWSPSGKEEVIPVLKNIDINAMINKGKQYLGVKYKFGTGPYPQTGRFDCSTFTQYVYGKYGVRLPRLAREQERVGTLVSRKALRKGDLMFFYVPGRFKSNKTVGHVGIYIGNMQMLHSSPAAKNGVQISDISKPYWKSTFLRAKRIVY
ncbi:Cell wall-associated hydrolase, NlpC family [Paenibacillus sp. yr247]|uniref:C40 family peptidase n=1 Tax=Paenibacillus sp. yr247 TaxID=1761880 RepID=UPI00088D0C0D|nr:C40 family peptidase [Paenibacillus sp. yr247]SDN22714.1 Cell wall-associated hydrolase, NlpC family [Paenibacillus sp. yr247]